MRALLLAMLVALGLAPAHAGHPFSDLPVHVTEPRGGAIKAVIILWSGDGGWTGTMQNIADALADRGYGVVGISALRYFWSEKAPKTMAKDTDRLVFHFTERWQTNKVVLAGYSFGADTLPFAWPAMNAETQDVTALIALLSPFKRTEFEVSIRGMLGIVHGKHEVVPAIEALPQDRVLCLTGDKETDMACSLTAGYEVASVPGGHNYDRNWLLIADIVNAAFDRRRLD
ncbi:AcvB/VirJ family lysyl-phosphatidylglycerol hydrolase [Hoeflea sp.]|uniref:AcvB/VirJ family lysyl-phosphatidylglycerol hydrolase n=1 Tax=Hoeflea sp. TaxID=1940281 RepID=UPI003B01E161